MASLFARRRAGVRRVFGAVSITDATLLLIKLLGVKSIRDVQNQRDQLLVVRLGAHPRFGRDASARARHPVVPHTRQVNLPGPQRHGRRGAPSGGLR